MTPADAMGQNRLFLSPPHMSGRELRYVEQAFASNYVAPAGPMLEQFEQRFAKYTDIPYVVAVSSGTAAIHLALKSLTLSPGDEVWASTLTFIGGISPILYEGSTPVFLDVDESWTLDPNLLAEELRRANRRSKLPRAVIATDLYGQPCDVDAIKQVCDQYDIALICDSAESVGARFKDRHAGSGAFAAAFSFNGNKVITTSGGGMLASGDRKVIDRARFLATQAREPVAHYEHVEAGYNYRLSNICAAIGLGQMEVLDSRVARRREIFDLYRSALGNLPGLSFMPEQPRTRSNRWLTVLQIDRASDENICEALRLALEQENIEARPVWKPMHQQPVFRGARSFGGSVADRLFKNGICLPSGSQMTDDDVHRVAAIVRRAL
ncbi:MAG TPA: aminotransferase class I/II-fold pyridoxal phosphate-dependent enzyme [Reyranella sp.]|nr:aminotransferase class I/II-fold pyridoxal phosphate-dependent enzyme [Reyranella sp.]